MKESLLYIPLVRMEWDIFSEFEIVFHHLKFQIEYPIFDDNKHTRIINTQMIFVPLLFGLCLLPLGLSLEIKYLNTNILNKYYLLDLFHAK